MRERRKDRLVRHLLNLTRMPIKDIASRAKVHNAYVTQYNIRHRIRPPELNREIQMQARAALREKQRRNFFSSQQKLALIDENIPGIITVARRWFNSSRLLKNDYGSLQNLIDTLRSNAFDTLDFYDPATKTKVGAADAGKWITYGADRFCREEASHLRSNSAFQFPMTSTGTTRDFPEPSKVISAQPLRPSVFDSAAIPRSAKIFLKKLGGNVDSAAAQGFENVKSIILEIADAPATGLTAIEKQIVAARLNGEQLENIGPKLSRTGRIRPGQKVAGFGREQTRQFEKKQLKKSGGK
ncbi:MAG: hypothetical protein PHD95_06340 [Candidatus ainarchaeum sp.]|nr:hypothetical protein [Candidatus ainarchaeum sp.]